jgi:hypothetical protein
VRETLDERSLLWCRLEQSCCLLDKIRSRSFSRHARFGVRPPKRGEPTQKTSVTLSQPVGLRKADDLGQKVDCTPQQARIGRGCRVQPYTLTRSRTTR